MKLRAAILVDRLSVTKWQQAALDAAQEKIEIVMLLNCQNTYTKKRIFKNFLYYILNIFTLRNNLTKIKKIKQKPPIIINFNSSYNGNWQSIPKWVYSSLDKEKIDLVIKFGMSLLHVDNTNLTPFLSYHHGDPSKYRGRPAGFYEILNGDLTSGIIVQKISNKIDSGKVLAFSTSKIVNFSYKRTALNFYENSEYLLKKAIDNLNKGEFINLIPDGKNYRLPNNFTVIKFVALMFLNAIRKLYYGLFFEKKWKVAILNKKISLKGEQKIFSKDFIEIPVKSKYNFYADPFFSKDGNKIRLEALDKITGLGDILEIETNNFFKQEVLLSGNHYSYPFSFEYKEKEYLLPEVSTHSSQLIYNLNTKIYEKHLIKGLESKRIVDATLLKKDDYYFLFFGEIGTDHTLLNLWYSSSPFDKFISHPMSPIVISPEHARMGGRLLYDSDRLIRFGQNNAGEYGCSLVILEVLNLTTTLYQEKLIGSVTIDNYKGPHSLCFNSDASKILLDFYKNEFSLLAGLRRIKAKLNKK